MIRFLLHIVALLVFIPAFADQPDKKPQAVLPVQEKVYLHFDNNCYFLGDTIWYKAYVVLADDNTPQPLSKILYVELLDEQGYILERQQLVVDDNGQANGQFAICDTTFAGYYEVRAYTKWMLNFGYEHVYSWYSKSWYRPDMENGWYPVENDELQALMQQQQNDTDPKYVFKGSMDIYLDDEGKEIDQREKTQKKVSSIVRKDREYDTAFNIDKDGMERNYRQYSNLFSRVIPVYSRPDSAQNYMRKIIPTKITMGDFQVNWLTPEFDVKFYPEGGTLVEGFPCKVAWEAMNQELERLNVSGVLLEDGEEIDSIRPFHAGRGMFTFTPQHGKSYKARFVFGEHKFNFNGSLWSRMSRAYISMWHVTSRRTVNSSLWCCVAGSASRHSTSLAERLYGKMRCIRKTCPKEYVRQYSPTTKATCLPTGFSSSTASTRQKHTF